MGSLEEYARVHWKSVTFCRECKHYVPIGKTKKFGCKKNAMMGIPMPKKPDHYCAEGEARHDR